MERGREKESGGGERKNKGLWGQGKRERENECQLPKLIGYDRLRAVTATEEGEGERVHAH